MDRTLVRSGFDTETLVSEQYLTYMLLAQVEAGLLEMDFEVVDADTNTNVRVKLHPPADEDYQRLYVPTVPPQLPDPIADSFRLQLLPGEESGFADVAFAPGDTHVLTRSYDNMVRVWDTQLSTQDDLRAFAVDVAIGSVFDKDCTRIATASADHRIRIWDIASKTVVQTLLGHASVVECVAFSPDGTRLASGSFDQTLRVWDLTTTTGTLVHTITGHTGRVMSVAFNHAGTQIVSGGEDGTIRRWDAQTGAALGEPLAPGHQGAVNSVVFSPNDLRIASGSDDKTVRLWNPAAMNPLVRTFDEHTDAVLWVDIGDNGARLLSASRDKSFKLWSASSTFSLSTNTSHRSPVTRVRFDSSGLRNSSVSSGGSIRLWDSVLSPKPKIIEIRRDFMRADVLVTIIDHNKNDQTSSGLMLTYVYLALYADQTANGLETNHKLRLSFGRLDPSAKAVLESNGVNVPLVEDTLREKLDRDLPLGVAQGQAVQQIRMRKLLGDHGQRTLGIYVNLALRKGPGNDFVPPRGFIEGANDFREPLQKIAFATSKELFGLLGPDAKFQRAERSAGAGYDYPLRKDISDPSSEAIGSIDGITVGPRLVQQAPNGPWVPSGQLAIDIDATYNKTTPDVGITAHFWFRPKRDSQGVVDWESDVDVNLGLLATLLLMIVSVVVLFFYVGPLSIGISIAAGSLTGLVARGIAEHYGAKTLAEKSNLEQQAGVLDSLPFRLPVAVRRWDPFYTTQYQVVALLDEDMIIDRDGIAFAAEEVRLDKQPIAQVDIAPVGELRDTNGLVSIRYEVPDFRDAEPGFTALGPGVDRLDSVRDDRVNEPSVVTLTLGQILERKSLDHPKILAPIVLDAQRIYLGTRGIDQILCATWRIRSQQRDRLLREFQENARAEIEANELAGIIQDVTADLGSGASQEEIDEAVELRVVALIADRQENYEENHLREHLQVALAPLLRFDLAPEELIGLQQQSIFSLDGKEIIVRHNHNGTVTPYYRDRPDGDPRDNLLALPHYTSPYVPPP